MKQKQIEESISNDAAKAFKDHKLAHHDSIGGRWYMMRPGRSEFSTEIICLRGGRLFVGGDIDDCVFAYFSPSSPTKPLGNSAKLVARVAWIANSHLGYVSQKAIIGFGGNSDPFFTWDESIAKEDLESLLDDLREDENSEEILETIGDIIDRGSFYENEVYEELSRWGSSLELPRHFGKHVSARVIYAHAATKRLLELLSEG